MDCKSSKGDGGVDGTLSNALGRTPDDPNPSQVVGGGGGAGADSATAPNVIDEDGSGEQERVALADRVVLQKLQVGLLASLPLGDRLELRAPCLLGTFVDQAARAEFLTRASDISPTSRDSTATSMKL